MQWPRKLYDHEVIPPPHCWEDIREKIAGEPLALGQSLYDAAVPPPPGAWDQIRSQIQPAPEQKIPAPVRRMTMRPALRYAAAAAVLLLLSSGLWYVFTRNDSGLRMADLAAGLGFADSPAKSVVATDKETASGNGEGSAPNANATVAEGSMASNNTSQPMLPAADDTQISYEDGNYIQLVEPDGDVTRVSYKFRDMLRAVQQKKEAAVQWNKQLENWKKQMASSSYIPSGSNFFDLAEMVQVMNNGQ